MDNSWLNPSFKDSVLGRAAEDSFELAKHYTRHGVWNPELIRNSLIRDQLEKQVENDARSIKAARWLSDANPRNYLFGALAGAKEMEGWSLNPFSSRFPGKKNVRLRGGEKAIGGYNTLANWERQQRFGDAGVDPMIMFPDYRDAPRENIWWLIDKKEGGTDA